MERADFKIYLRAKKGMKVSRYLSVIFAIAAVGFPFLGNWGVETSGYANVTPTFMITAVFFWFGYCGVPQSQLLKIIEKQINRDPEAIQFMTDNDN
ncbi:hypothetical protein Q4561_18075 [Alteromonas sp. 1_MG-2023]|uniref:hypothetical protein n=1 Tax=Alteromonas sp. 1_MG-2023 TaxID=3062669 RepID=UPI0026E28F3D|nr:hypothetical protein [Alteromonas sp. 1_MG-2023]MDO6568985.1 hypothetical protein [Alteromonas sp. 1_MG-2023]